MNANKPSTLYSLLIMSKRLQNNCRFVSWLLSAVTDSHRVYLEPLQNVYNVKLCLIRLAHTSIVQQTFRRKVMKKIMIKCNQNLSTLWFQPFVYMSVCLAVWASVCRFKTILNKKRYSRISIQSYILSGLTWVNKHKLIRFRSRVQKCELQTASIIWWTSMGGLYRS